MPKSIKLKENTYWDSSSVMHNRKTLSEILDINVGTSATYTLSDTTGWKRIARLDGISAGNIIIKNEGGQHGSIGSLSISSIGGWSVSINKNYKSHANEQYFTKARLVRKGNNVVYLEIYQNISEAKTLYVYVDYNSIGISLFSSETSGDVPTGYTATEIDYL